MEKKLLVMISLWNAGFKAISGISYNILGQQHIPLQKTMTKKEREMRIQSIICPHINMQQ